MSSWHKTVDKLLARPLANCLVLSPRVDSCLTWAYTHQLVQSKLEAFMRLKTGAVAGLDFDCAEFSQGPGMCFWRVPLTIELHSAWFEEIETLALDSLQQWLNNCEAELNLRDVLSKVCKRCNGSGRAFTASASVVDCSVCKGRGYVY